MNLILNSYRIYIFVDIKYIASLCLWHIDILGLYSGRLDNLGEVERRESEHDSWILLHAQFRDLSCGYEVSCRRKYQLLQQDFQQCSILWDREKVLKARLSTTFIDKVYELIDLMLPGTRKVEIFARNHNIRPGWFSMGNQLGELFNKWANKVECNNCGLTVLLHNKRYKSTNIPNYDICEKCHSSLPED